MVYTDFIAAIDLGTTCLTGMVGKKNASGTLTVYVTEVEQSDGCIRRGCVYNVEETAVKIERLIRKLSGKLSGAKISKVYIGIGGQSLHTVDHTVSRELGDEGVVTKELIDSLQEECRQYHPDLLDVLDAVSPVYLLDGKPEASPVGIPCQQIEARYKLIVGRPSLKRYVGLSVSEKARMEIAGILVSPLALADVVLSKEEKELGCALVDFGAGVTNVVIYKGGKLKDLSAIPLGGNTITKDIMTLNVVEEDAERLKLTYGSAVADWEDETTIELSSSDGMHHPDIKLADLNNVIEARAKEILENVVARLEATGLLPDLGAGLIIAGGASELKGLHRTIKERLNMEVRYATLRKGLIEDDKMVDLPGYAVTAGLLMQGTVNCAVVPANASPVVEPAELFGKDEVETVQPPQPKVQPQPVNEKVEDTSEVVKPKKKGLFRGLTQRVENIGRGLFDDDSF